jgi:PBP4 family serine-type D-alanyl-D-alanine carboxypeptidase
LPIAVGAAAGDAAVQSELERIVGHWRAKAEREGSRSKAWSRGQVQVALCVRAEPTGAEVAAIAADRALRPASNLKLVTTATALALLGPDAAFHTPLQLQGAFDSGPNGVLVGDLVVQGGGDPLHDRADPRYAETRLRDVARALKQRGLTHVRGALVLDEGAFDAPAPGPGWPSASQHWQDYCALSGAFSANGGMLTALVRAGRVGENALVELHPAPSGIPESIGVATVAGGKSDVQIGANARGATVRGSLGISAEPVDASFAHPDPVQLFGACLLGALRAEGIEVERGIVRERRRWRADVATAVVLETPIAHVLTAINADSTNPVADQLFFATGAAAGGAPTRAGGRAATARALTELGVSSDGLVQVDGSGLSRDNRISARQLSALVHAVLAGGGESAALWRGSLALAGQTGTLEKRLVGTPSAGRVRAKTGFIGGTSSLSGVATSLDGREHVFSILVNYPDVDGLNNSCWKPMQDEIVQFLVERLP